MIVESGRDNKWHGVQQVGNPATRKPVVATDAHQAGRQTSQGRSSRTERARQVCTYQLTPYRDKMENVQSRQTVGLARTALRLVAWNRIGGYRVVSNRIKSNRVSSVELRLRRQCDAMAALVFVSWIGRLSRRVVKTLRSHGSGQDRRRQASPRR